MRIVATVEARMRSNRLPGKVMKPILGRPMLALMIERLQRVPQLDEIVIATTDDSSCDPIAELADRMGVSCFRGSEEDVLGRVLQAARQARAELVVETTGDCPLIDPGVIDQTIRTFVDNDADYCCNMLGGTYPRGMDVQVFPLSVLEEVASLTEDPACREHVTLFINEHPEKFRRLDAPSDLPPGVSELRLTVDTAEDFDLITRIYEALYPTKPTFSLKDILNLCDRQPDLRAINRHIRQKAVRRIDVSAAWDAGSRGGE